MDIKIIVFGIFSILNVKVINTKTFAKKIPTNTYINFA